METPQIAPQVEFKTLEDFVACSNNFYGFFFENASNIWSKSQRGKPVFKRFQVEHANLEKDLTCVVSAFVSASKSSQNLPWEKLFEAYKIMSQLVYVDDPHVTLDGKSDHRYLLL